ncbi:MAG: hypothetical protein QM784_10020 [Polyangiaceae bacterium]
MELDGGGGDGEDDDDGKRGGEDVDCEIDGDDDRDSEELEWDDLVGKHVLVGITFQDRRGKVFGMEQIHGRIDSFDPEHGVAIELTGANAGEKFMLPPDLGAFQLAEPGEYRLRSTGEVVTDPDLLATWTVLQADA